MRILRKVFLSSIIMLLVPTAMFAVLYGFLLYAAKADTTSIQSSVIGTWKGIQYYRDGEKIVCSQGHPISVIFTEESISIVSDEFPKAENLLCTWGKKTVQFRWDAEDISASLHFDESGYLRMTVSEWKLDLVLSSEGR